MQNETMNKTELVNAIAEKTGIEKNKVGTVVNEFFNVVTDELKSGGSVQIVGFGSFEVVKKAAREGRNPLTGETMKIAARKAPKFKAGKSLKEAVNAGKDKKKK